MRRNRDVWRAARRGGARGAARRGGARGAARRGAWLVTTAAVLALWAGALGTGCASDTAGQGGQDGQGGQAASKPSGKVDPNASGGDTKWNPEKSTLQDDWDRFWLK